MAKKKCRVLVTTTIGAVVYLPDQVVNIETALARPHIVVRALDDGKEAVAYAISQGAVVIEHSAAADDVVAPPSTEATSESLSEESAATPVVPDEAASTQQ